MCVYSKTPQVGSASGNHRKPERQSLHSEGKCDFPVDAARTSKNRSDTTPNEQNDFAAERFSLLRFISVRCVWCKKRTDRQAGPADCKQRRLGFRLQKSDALLLSTTGHG